MKLQTSPLFALGFRPFYLFAGLFAIVSIAFWLLTYVGDIQAGGYLRGVFWHRHEMVYGFAIAVMAGFLLTAVRNWTGLPTPTGLALAGLAAVWLAGRVFIVTGPPMLAALVDVTFIPLLAVAIAVPIIRSRNGRNYKIVALLALIAIAHLVYHLAFLGSFPSWLNHTSVISAIELITLVFAIVAGRVIPAFTRNAIPGSDPKNETWLETLAFGSLVLIAIATVSSDWVSVPVLIPTVLLVIAAVSHSLRLALWQPHLTVTRPLLWMMPVAYSWLPLALFLRALAGHAVVGQGAWIHALTAGAISGMMLAMMMRSSLGHTGRALEATSVDMSAFLLLQLAAIVRVTAGFFSADLYRPLVIFSGVLWVLAFSVFVARYLPMFVKPRIDGRPG